MEYRLRYKNQADWGLEYLVRKEWKVFGVVINKEKWEQCDNFILPKNLISLDTIKHDVWNRIGNGTAYAKDEYKVKITEAVKYLYAKHIELLNEQTSYIKLK